MTFARILNNGDIVHPYRVPNVLRLSDGDHDLRSGAVELLASYGIFQVVDTARPVDTDTTTHDRTVELVAGVPTVVWTPRAWTVDEQANRAAEDNGRTIRAGALNALTANRAFLANGAPTAAELRAQVAALTRQNVALIRSQFGALDGVD